MIKLTRLKGEPFLLNCELIEFIEETPDTVISMTSGRKVVVIESSEEVKERVIEYKRAIVNWME